MLKERREAAQGIADRLIQAERSIDAAIAAVADLNGYMPMIRSRINVSAVVGHEAIEAAAGSFAALVRARGQMIEAHNVLAQTKIQMGLREVAVGGLEDKTPGKPMAIVGAVAA